MRRYEEGTERKLTRVVCNMCGRQLKLQDGRLREGCFTADAVFGYFSRKDGETHHFDLCEDCYDGILAKFRVPAETEEETELL